MDKLTTAFVSTLDDVWNDEDWTPSSALFPPRRQPGYKVETLFDSLDICAAVFEPAVQPTRIEAGQPDA